MNESFWGSFIISAGIIIITLIFFMQKVTNTNEQLYTLLKETTEAAMVDALDISGYQDNANDEYLINKSAIRINREAFVESFLRRFSQNANLANTYIVEIYDISEYPPKVSLKVKTKEGQGIFNKRLDFNLENQIDAILETKD